MEGGSNQSASRSIFSLKVSLIAQVVTIITGVLKTFVFTIFISPGNFGLIALSASITGIIQLLKDFGYSTYIIQNKDLNETELVAINTRVFLLGFLAFVFSCIIAFPLASFYHQPELKWIIAITGIQFVFNSFTIVPIALLRRSMDFDKVAKIEVGSNIFSLLFGLLLLLFMRNYWVLLFSGVSYLAFQLVLTAKYNSWHFRMSNPLKNRLSKHSTKFGTQITVFNVLTFITTNLDNIIIGKLFGNSVLGLYSKGFEFGVTNVDKIKRPVQNVYFSDVANKSNETRRNFFFQYLLFILTILLIIVGPIVIYSHEIVQRIFGHEWNSLDSMMTPFFLSSFLWVTMSFADQLLIVTSKMKPYLILGIAKNTIGSLSIVIASFWGPNAIAWSYFYYHILFFLPFCFYSFQSVSINRQQTWKMLLETTLVVVCAIMAVFIPWMLQKLHLISVNISVSLFLLLATMVVVYVWRATGAEEPYLFIKYIFKRKAISQSRYK